METAEGVTKADSTSIISEMEPGTLPENGEVSPLSAEPGTLPENGEVSPPSAEPGTLHENGEVSPPSAEPGTLPENGEVTPPSAEPGTLHENGEVTPPSASTSEIEMGEGSDVSKVTLLSRDSEFMNLLQLFFFCIFGMSKEKEASEGHEEVTPSASTSDDTAVIEVEDDTIKTSDLRKHENRLFFVDDPSLRIDYVLSFKHQLKDEKLKYRQLFQENLEREGLRLEEQCPQDIENSSNQKLSYLLIHGTWKALTTGAELMNMKKRIKMPKDMEGATEGCCYTCHPCTAGPNIVPEEDDYFTASFNRQRIEMFEIDYDNKESFFTNSERSLILKTILDRTQFTPDDATKVGRGLTKLLRDGVYVAGFPLHEGRYKPRGNKRKSSTFKGPDKDRLRLYEAWARPGRWYCRQPLDLIRKYFGEKIGIYFAWLGFYTAMLIPAAIVGLVAFIYGLATLYYDTASYDICNKRGAGNLTMCPLCDVRCGYWKLHDSCLYSRLSYLFDNEATVAFAVFMSIWAVLFLEFWKRKQKELEYEWDVADFELDQMVRPEYEFNVVKTKVNPITNVEEPYLSFISRCCRIFTAYCLVLFMICLVLGAIFGVIIYRIVVVALMYAVGYDPVSTYAKLLTTVTAACINLVIILILNVLYRVIAAALNNLEMHRTETEYEDSFIFKMFLFQFVNYYGSIFYIAFFKGRFTGPPGSHDYLLFDKYRQDECLPSGCLIELCIQLAIVFLGKQALNNVKEVIIPWIKNWYLTRTLQGTRRQRKVYMRWQRDQSLTPLPPMGLFDEYLEMVIQYGFVTVFVAAFPLAPFFALVNNIIEIRLDALKFVTLWQRPAAYRAQNIGIWYDILQGLSFLAVLSNAFIIGFTTDFIPKMVYRFVSSRDKSLDGYVNHTLSVFATNDFNDSMPSQVDAEFDSVSYCRYRDYREPPDSTRAYEYTMEYWQIFTARLAFVVVFEHACFFITWLLTNMIPDVPGPVKRLMIYEKQLVRKINFDLTFGKDMDEKKQQ